MNDKVSGIFEDNGSYGMINGEHLIIKGDENGAKSGDRVEAVDVSDNPSIVQFKIIKIINDTLSKVEDLLVGIYKKNIYGRGGYVDVSKGNKGIFIERGNEHGAKSGDKVEIIVSKVGKNSKGLVKNIIQTKAEQEEYSKEFLGNNYNNKNKVDILNVALKEGARIKFPDEVLEEAENLNGNIESSEIEKRNDLRELFTITIDGADSKDLDDAISIEKLDKGSYKLYVHIADVTHYVNENKSLDNEALQRATSIYLVDKVIPMLPEKLSNDYCSLNPNTDKLTVTCEMVIDKNGKINTEKSKVYESVINSNFRTTYKEIEDIKTGDLSRGNKLLFGGKINKDLEKLVSVGECLANNLNKYTKDNGELEFDFDETKVIVDKKGNPTGFKPYPKYPSNDWIKAFMVAANRTVSKIYEDKPFLHRTHLTPKDASVEKLQNILALLGISFIIIDDPSSEKFSELLEAVKGHEKQKFLEKAILKTMQRANYTADREGHFGLSLDYYSHFTSPIRRYPDLQIHRIIKEILNGNFDDIRVNHYKNILDQIASKSSIEEDKSEDIERKVNKLMAVKYMSEKIGEKFNGFISDVNDKGVFVELENTIDGVVNIDKSFYNFNKLCEGLYEGVSKNGDRINVGDEVDLELVSVDNDNLRIVFEIV